MNLTQRKIRDTFTHWTADQCRAYYLGVVCVLEDPYPGNGFQPYENRSVFFLRGMADAMGEDAIAEDWWIGEITRWTIRECWWNQDDESDEE